MDIPREVVLHAADGLLPVHPLGRVVTYFLMIIALRYAIAGALAEWLHDRVSGGG